MYKILVAGCGSMSNAWIEYAKKRNDCEIVGLIDININTAKAKNEEHKLNAEIYSDINTALEDSGANLVFDITIPQAHFDTVCTALNAGCHVFGEKPMSDSLSNAEKMVRCAEETGKEYFVLQNYRYNPEIQSLKRFFKTGNPGNIGQISADFRIEIHFGGFRDEMDSPLIADMAIHTFDAARFITGKNAVSVYCHEFNPPWSWYKGDANAVCIFEMEDGSVFDYRGSWCANGLHTSWESQWRISCTKGAAFWDGNDQLYYEENELSTFVTSSLSAEEKAAFVHNITPLAMEYTGHEACVSEMFDALKNGTRPQTDCRDNIHSIRMVYQAIESARFKKVISL